MDNYSGYDRPTNRRQTYLKRIFDEQIKQFGESVIIEGVESVGLIANDLNPYAENKEDRKLEVDLSVKVKKGDYIKYKNNNYMVVSNIDEFEVSKDCRIRKCEQTFKWRDDKGEIHEYPIITQYASYGTKLFQAASDQLSQVSTNIDATIQRNDITETIPLNTRFILGKSANGVYIVGDIAVYEEETLKLTCKKTISVSEDDLQNNLAFNGTITPPTPTTYTITGSPTIRVNTSTTYTLAPSTTDVTWEVDAPTIATITSQDTNTCTVKANVMDEIVILTAKQNGVVLTTFVIQTMR